MKREHVKQYEHGIYKHYGLFFWQQCSCCKRDFRREKGFRFLVGPFVNILGGGHWRYLCEKCAPSKSDANEYAVLGKYISPRPPPPPQPPKIRNLKENEQPTR